MKYTYNDESLKRRGVSRQDVDEVLAETNVSTREFELPLSSTDNPRTMFVGFNNSGRLFEIGIEFEEKEILRVFHTQTVSPEFRRLYEDQLCEEQINNE
jgi:hypothetical protein